MEEDCKLIVRNFPMADKRCNLEVPSVISFCRSGEDIKQMPSSPGTNHDQNLSSIILKSEPEDVKSVINTGHDDLTVTAHHTVTVSPDVKSKDLDQLRVTDDDHLTSESCSISHHNESTPSKPENATRLIEHSYESGVLSMPNKPGDFEPCTDCVQYQEYLPNLSNFLKQKYPLKLQEDMMNALRCEMIAISGNQCRHNLNNDTRAASQGYYYPDVHCLEQRHPVSNRNGTPNATTHDCAIKGTSPVRDVTDHTSSCIIQNNPDFACDQTTRESKDQATTDYFTVEERESPLHSGNWSSSHLAPAGILLPTVPPLPDSRVVNASPANASYTVSSSTEQRKEKHRVQERCRRAKIKLAFEDLRRLVPGTSRLADRTVLLKYTACYIRFLQHHLKKKLDKEFMDQVYLTSVSGK